MLAPVVAAPVARLGHGWVAFEAEGIEPLTDFPTWAAANMPVED